MMSSLYSHDHSDERGGCFSFPCSSAFPADIIFYSRSFSCCLEGENSDAHGHKASISVAATAESIAALKRFKCTVWGYIIDHGKLLFSFNTCGRLQLWISGYCQIQEGEDIVSWCLVQARGIQIWQGQ